jgi:hypothetical protein
MMKKYFCSKIVPKLKPNLGITLKDFNLTKPELKELNNKIKEQWVKPDKDKIV